MICIYIPRHLVELYHCQGWEVIPIGHHTEYSFLAVIGRAILETEES